MKRGCLGRKGVFVGVIVYVFLTFVCYLRVNRKLNNMPHYQSSNPKFKNTI